MTHEVRQLLHKALALPENEPAELAGNLIASLDTAADQDVDAVWQREVSRRNHRLGESAAEGTFAAADNEAASISSWG
jgi:hypothetical protein